MSTHIAHRRPPALSRVAYWMTSATVAALYVVLAMAVWAGITLAHQALRGQVLLGGPPSIAAFLIVLLFALACGAVAAVLSKIAFDRDGRS